MFLLYSGYGMCYVCVVAHVHICMCACVYVYVNVVNFRVGHHSLMHACSLHHSFMHACSYIRVAAKRKTIRRARTVLYQHHCKSSSPVNTKYVCVYMNGMCTHLYELCAHLYTQHACLLVHTACMPTCTHTGHTHQDADEWIQSQSLGTKF